MIPTHPTDRLRLLEGSTGLNSTDNAALPHAWLGLRAAGFFIWTTLYQFAIKRNFLVGANLVFALNRRANTRKLSQNLAIWVKMYYK